VHRIGETQTRCKPNLTKPNQRGGSIKVNQKEKKRKKKGGIGTSFQNQQ
jgi:hypothetical protein